MWHAVAPQDTAHLTGLLPLPLGPPSYTLFMTGLCGVEEGVTNDTQLPFARKQYQTRDESLHGHSRKLAIISDAMSRCADQALTLWSLIESRTKPPCLESVAVLSRVLKMAHAQRMARWPCYKFVRICLPT